MIKNPISPEDVIKLLPKKNAEVVITTNYSDIFYSETPYVSSTIISRLKKDKRVSIAKANKAGTFTVKRLS
jgi:predicted polyphosphate/ATP-dependent NAD kinase